MGASIFDLKFWAFFEMVDNQLLGISKNNNLESLQITVAFEATSLFIGFKHIEFIGDSFWLFLDKCLTIIKNTDVL